MATYVIGDVHGCFDELQNLLQAFAFNPSADELWFTGDLVNGGPKSVETLEFIMELGEKAICVLGNHDLTLLAIEYANLDLEQVLKLDSKKVASLNDSGFNHILTHPQKAKFMLWLRSKRLAHFAPKFNTLLVHAGVAPQWTLETTLTLAKEIETILKNEGQAKEFFKNMFGNKPSSWHDKLTSWDRMRCIVNYMTRMRFCTSEGKLDFAAKGPAAGAPIGTMPWFEVAARKTKNINIVFGHWAALHGVTNCANVFALDTGCIWGNQLSALRLEDQQRFSVDYITK